MKKFSIILISIFLLVLAGPTLAKKPHPTNGSETKIAIDSCTCDNWALVFVDPYSEWQGDCDVQWTVTDMMWPAYGASLDFKATWFDGFEISMSSDSEVMDDDYTCALGNHVGDNGVNDDRCNAVDVFTTLPDYDLEGEFLDEDFRARVKGFYNGHGPRSRDFQKASGACTGLPVPE